MTFDKLASMAVSAPGGYVRSQQIVSRPGVLGHPTYYVVTVTTRARQMSHQECVELGLSETKESQEIA